MPDRRELVAQELRQLAADLRSLATTLSRDPKKQARKERRYNLLLAALSAVFALAARRLVTKAWGVLTGEPPPGKGEPKPAPRSPGAATPTAAQPSSAAPSATPLREA
jgi:hypothetical protein